MSAVARPSSSTRREQTELDGQRILFLTTYYDAEDWLLYYSLDVELADDAHYDFSATEGLRLEQSLQKIYDGSPLADSLKRYFQNAVSKGTSPESAVTWLLKEHEIDYRAFHY